MIWGMSEKLRVIMMGFGGRPDVLEEAERLRPIVSELAEIVDSDFTGKADMSKVEADAAIVLGGDGSILRAAHQMGHRQLPVVAVNLGKLGFLADLSPGEVPEVLTGFAAGKLDVIEHLMFECSVIREGETRFRKLGLNEVAVQTGPLKRHVQRGSNTSSVCGAIRGWPGRSWPAWRNRCGWGQTSSSIPTPITSTRDWMMPD